MNGWIFLFFLYPLCVFQLGQVEAWSQKQAGLQTSFGGFPTVCVATFLLLFWNLKKKKITELKKPSPNQHWVKGEGGAGRMVISYLRKNMKKTRDFVHVPKLWLVLLTSAAVDWQVSKALPNKPSRPRQQTAARRNTASPQLESELQWRESTHLAWKVFFDFSKKEDVLRQLKRFISA